MEKEASNVSSKKQHTITRVEVISSMATITP